MSEIADGRTRGAIGRVLDLIGETRRLRPTGIAKWIVAAFSVAAVFLITYLALFGVATVHLQISLFLTLILPMAFLTSTASARLQHLTLLDYILAAAGFGVSVWFAANEPRYAEWMTGFSEPTAGDTIAGTVLMLLCFELCRRAVGIGLTVILLVLLAYVGFGQYLGGSFNHPPVTFDYFLEMQVIGIDGVFGSPLYVAASYAFLFVLFGNFYVISGGGQLFFDVAAAVTGRYVGGPAKACVVPSRLYGPAPGRPGRVRASTRPVRHPDLKRVRRLLRS